MTHPGSNMDAHLAERLDVDLLPVHLAVDGVMHDLRAPVPPGVVQEWSRGSRTSPVEIGAGATDLVRYFCELGEFDGELLVVTAHEQVSPTYAAAMLAVVTMLRGPSLGDVRIRVVSSRSADLGVGLLTMLATEARRRGLDVDATADLLEGVAQESVTALAPTDASSLVTLGVRDRMGTRFGRCPIVGVQRGTLGVVDHYRAKEGPVPALLRQLASLRGRQVWMGIAHIGAEDLAGQLEAQIRKSVSVEHLSQTPLAPSLAMGVQSGSLGVFAVPVDGIGFAARSPSMQPPIRRAA